MAKIIWSQARKISWGNTRISQFPAQPRKIYQLFTRNGFPIRVDKEFLRVPTEHTSSIVIFFHQCDHIRGGYNDSILIQF